MSVCREEKLTKLGCSSTHLKRRKKRRTACSCRPAKLAGEGSLFEPAWSHLEICDRACRDRLGVPAIFGNPEVVKRSRRYPEKAPLWLHTLYFCPMVFAAFALVAAQKHPTLVPQVLEQKGIFAEPISAPQSASLHAELFRMLGSGASDFRARPPLSIVKAHVRDDTVFCPKFQNCAGVLSLLRGLLLPLIAHSNSLLLASEFLQKVSALYIV